MSTTIIHADIHPQNFNPVISLTQEQISTLITAEAIRQAYAQFGTKKNSFKINSVATFRILDDRLVGNPLELLEKFGSEIKSPQKVNTRISTTVTHDQNSAHGTLAKEYVTDFDKDALAKLIKEVFVAPYGFHVAEVNLCVSFKSAKNSSLQANLTLALKD